MAAMDPDKDLAINDRRAEEEKAKAFMKAFGIEMPTIFYPHEMKVVLDRNITVVLLVDINPYSEEAVFHTETLMLFLQEYLLLDPLNERFGFDLPEDLDKSFLTQKGFSIDIDMKYQTIDLTSPVELRRKQDIFVSSASRRVLSLTIYNGDSTYQWLCQYDPRSECWCRYVDVQWQLSWECEHRRLGDSK